MPCFNRDWKAGDKSCWGHVGKVWINSQGLIWSGAGEQLSWSVLTLGSVPSTAHTTRSGTHPLPQARCSRVILIHSEVGVGSELPRDPGAWGTGPLVSFALENKGKCLT